MCKHLVVLPSKKQTLNICPCSALLIHTEGNVKSKDREKVVKKTKKVRGAQPTYVKFKQ